MNRLDSLWRDIRSKPAMAAAAAFVAGVLFASVVWGVAVSTSRQSVQQLTSDAGPQPGRTSSPTPSASGDEGEEGSGASLEPDSDEQEESKPSASAPALPADRPTAPADCPEPTTSVATAEELQSALDGASPGDVIEIEDGHYVGEFLATVSGTEDEPITLCGGTEAILDGGDYEGDYVFHLDGAKYWHLLGFTVTNGQKGVMADGTVGSIIEGLTVTGIGDEAIHLRKFSTDNVVTGNFISVTGLRRPKFGEGVYIGTAESNWCDMSDCKPDNSDRNIVENNTISETSSEAIDVKEGTSFGIVRNNTFDGSGIIDADSWVDIKGNDWVIEGNVGRNSPLDGFQTHEILDGWGTRNVFRGNTAEVNGPGFGFSLTPVRENVVECDNEVIGAAEGDMNVDCSR
ncbi:right-handed parallel beta-helix repeat-containing protein [Desertivibrio insolitus]|uniref:right-handed parallel beta-helix repeat-containing protein n=1 Tax=Herbiconiux sp. SYSU D00978 TaxID=2812562 RepID=UPI001F60B86E|nr:right-handed parallel beta-helix repeat-containing protein [Herbiconiux sp. SYSU D00978]